MQSTLAKLSLNILPQADADLEEIWLYTANEWSIEQADSYIIGLHTTFSILCETPEIARERTEFTPPVRLHPSGQHHVIYRIEGASLSVIRILHNRRNWQTYLSK